MAYHFEFAARLVRLRALLFATSILAFTGCDNSEPLSTEVAATPDSEGEAVQVGEPSLASTSFAGGIPIGTFGQPITAFGAHYNGAKMTVSPSGLVKYLTAVRARGGKVTIMLAGPDFYYKDRRGFNFTKWKARIDRFRGINLTPFINDGTIIGHFLMDEPNDPSNWYGRMVTPLQVDEMARYSKLRWPRMVTIIRARPGYFLSRRPRYLDAAWAQYATRMGNPSTYIRQQIAEAKQLGLGLIVGLNVSKGGPNRRRLTASEVRSFGSTFLASSYPCAFLSWEYGSYQLTGSMRDAMRSLRIKAQSRSRKACNA